MLTISIKNKSYKIVYCLKNYFVFESLTGYPFQFGKLLDEYVLFYSSILACNPGFDLLFDEFISICESDPALFNSFKSFMVQEIKLRSQFPDDEKKKTEYN